MKRKIATIMIIALMITLGGFTTSINAEAAPRRPAKVTSVKITGTTKSSITLKWKKAKRARRYQIARSVNGGKFKIVKTTSKRTWKNRGLKVNKKYRFKVRAIRKYKGRTYYGKYSKTKIKTIKVYANSINIKEPVPSKPLTVGDTFKLESEVLPKNTTNKNVTWRVAEGVASVDDDGNVTATDEGTFTIEAVTSNGKIAAITFEAHNWKLVGDEASETGSDQTQEAGASSVNDEPEIKEAHYECETCGATLSGHYETIVVKPAYDEKVQVFKHGYRCGTCEKKFAWHDYKLPKIDTRYLTEEQKEYFFGRYPGWDDINEDYVSESTNRYWNDEDMEMMYVHQITHAYIHVPAEFQNTFTCEWYETETIHHEAVTTQVWVADEQ